ncbi:BcsR/BcsP family cellulose biosynthesis protein [Orrella marina]|uniref:Uncharacterized protein n=1 Tax=Orrella marina TaxID=2163011 RepID=A0A2R4XM17_9BURK|nr:BcsR/BcsP family cellulose biosynthesis protein [Orrella marina]AWB34835.1 hypothetical protein DBV39_15105 [Orrella marina]
MSKSEDVTKLFAMFGEKNTDQYQEIYETEQNRATRERWPVFQRIHVQSDAPEPVTPVTSRAPLPRPFSSVPQSSTAATSSAAPKPLFPVASAEYRDTAPATQFAPPSHARVEPPAVAQSQSAHETSGDLRALFQRLEGRRAPLASHPEQPVTPPPAAAPEPAGSIRSLFSRLSR